MYLISLCEIKLKGMIMRQLFSGLRRFSSLPSYRGSKVMTKTEMVEILVAHLKRFEQDRVEQWCSR